MSVKSEDHNESLEKQILKVAEETFLDKGYAMTSMAEIAKRVGCNQALIHYYFRTKEKLFVFLFENKFASFMSVVFEQGDKFPSFKEKLRAIVIGHLAVVAENPKLPYLLISEVTISVERYSPAIERIRVKVGGLAKELDEELQREHRAGNIRRINAFDLLIRILSLNVFIFLAQPLYSRVIGLGYDEFLEFAKSKGEENFNVIWRSISLNPEE